MKIKYTAIVFSLLIICTTNLYSQDVEADKDIVGLIVVPVGPACESLKTDLNTKEESKKSNENETPKAECPRKMQESIVTKSSIDFINNIGKIQSYSDRQNILESCKQIENLKADYPEMGFIQKDKDGNKWKVKFYFGNSKTWYDKTDVTVKTSRIDAKITGAGIYERRSDQGLNFHNWIDEPTNDGTFTLTHGKNVFIFDSFHDKNVFVQGDQEAVGYHYNENVHVKGVVDGVAIDKDTKLKGDFGPNREMIPGNVYMVSWENAHKQMQFQLGYGREIDLIKSQGKPIVKFTPALMGGVYVGIKNSSYTKKGSGWEWDSYDSDKPKIMGTSVTASGKLEVSNRNDNFGAFVEGKYSVGHMKYDFLDGTAEHMQVYKSLTFGIEAKIVPLIKIKSKNKDKENTDDDPENGTVAK